MTVGEFDMTFSYGPGEYKDGLFSARGEILVSAHKLYLRDNGADIPRTYVPLEKIIRLRLRWSCLEVDVVPNMMSRYTAIINGKRSVLKSVVRDLVSQRGLKRVFFRWEWYDENPL